MNALFFVAHEGLALLAMPMGSSEGNDVSIYIMETVFLLELFATHHGHDNCCTKYTYALQVQGNQTKVHKILQ